LWERVGVRGCRRAALDGRLFGHQGDTVGPSRASGAYPSS
jgi:hypothetical protein